MGGFWAHATELTLKREFRTLSPQVLVSTQKVRVRPKNFCAMNSTFSSSNRAKRVDKRLPN